MTTTACRSPVSRPEQVESYRREGYLIYNQPVLPQEKFDALKAYFEKILADLPADERPEAMDVPHFMHPELFEVGVRRRDSRPRRADHRSRHRALFHPLHLQAEGQRQARAVA